MGGIEVEEYQLLRGQSGEEEAEGAGRRGIDKEIPVEKNGFQSPALVLLTAFPPPPPSLSVPHPGGEKTLASLALLYYRYLPPLRW